MYAAFVKLLNMSAAGAIMVPVVAILRLLLRKTPKKYICVLWALVALRLVCPFSISSAVSAYNYLGHSSQSSGQVEYIRYNGKREKPRAEVTVSLPTQAESDGAPTENTVTKDVYIPTLMVFWAAGAVTAASYAIISYTRIHMQVRESIRLRKNIFLCDRIPSPFILGIIRPKIYLPSGFERNQQRSVIAHERAHIARLDHLWKPLGYAILCVHWFNPLVWLAYGLFSRDMEMACDERVIRNMTAEKKQAYAALLLSCSMPGKAISACPLAFGEVDVKQRIRGILNYKKPSFWVVLVCVFLCAALAAAFLSDPVRTEDYIAFKGAQTKFDKPYVYNFRMQTGGNVGGPVVYAEMWQKGDLVESRSVTLPDNVTDLTVTMTGEKDGYTVSRYRVEAAGLDVTFSMPKETYLMDVQDWYGAKDISLMPDKQVLLAASIFDCGGNGFFMFEFDNEDYAEAGSRLRNQECVILVYAVFPAKNAAQNAVDAYRLNITRGPASVTYGALRFELPENWSLNMQEHKDDFDKTTGVFMDGSSVVGGIRSFLVDEETVLGNPDWIRELKLREWEDPMLGYSSGGGGDRYSIEFFSDVPPGEKRTVQNWHELYYIDGRVYDLWFDELLADTAVWQRVAESATLTGEDDQSAAPTPTIPQPVKGNLTLNQQETPDSLNILLHPTSAITIDGLGAYCPPNQQEWRSAWSSVVQSAPSTSVSAVAQTYYGVLLHLDDVYLEVHRNTQGLFLRKMGTTDCYGLEESKPLTSLLEPVLQDFFHNPVTPSRLGDLKDATLVLDGKAYFLQPGNPKLQELNAILASGKPTGMMTACLFTSQLSVTTQDGFLYTVSVATDSCGCYLSDGVCYEFPGDNAQLYQLFGVAPPV